MCCQPRRSLRQALAVAAIGSEKACQRPAPETQDVIFVHSATKQQLHSMPKALQQKHTATQQPAQVPIYSPRTVGTEET